MVCPDGAREMRVDVGIAGYHIISVHYLDHLACVQHPIEDAPVTAIDELGLLPTRGEHLEILQKVEKFAVIAVQYIVDDLIGITEMVHDPERDLLGICIVKISTLFQNLYDQFDFIDTYLGQAHSSFLISEIFCDY
jgi:hypothetical protein